MRTRDDAPWAGIFGALATAIAIHMPAYLPEDARDLVDDGIGQDNRFVSGPHRLPNDPVPIERIGHSTAADLGAGAEHETLLVGDGTLRAPDEVCVDVQLWRVVGRRGVLRLRIETATPAAVFVSIGGKEVEAKVVDTDLRSLVCHGDVRMVELVVPRRRRHARIDVELFLDDQDGTSRIVRRSFDVRRTANRSSSSARAADHRCGSRGRARARRSCTPSAANRPAAPGNPRTPHPAPC